MNALQRIEAADFPFLKVEFEAQLNRRGIARRDGSLYAACPHCAQGTITCDHCGDHAPMNTVCPICNQTGRLLCPRCNGNWEQEGTIRTHEYTENYCATFIKKHVPKAARDAVTFMKFYYDGSVDSEITITMPTAKAKYFVDYCKAFKKLADEIGGGLDTRGAGMHISTLLEGEYPYDTQMPSAKLNNFKKQVTKLLPALFFLASPNQRSRALGYRRPQISDSVKYSAIYTRRNTLFEFRLFETCYDRPEALLDNFEVIANCLEFYVHPRKQLELPHMRFGFSDHMRGIYRFYQTPAKLAVLDAGLAYLKPSHKTVAQLKQERKFDVTAQALLTSFAKKREALAKDYADTLTRWEWAAKREAEKYLPVYTQLRGKEWVEIHAKDQATLINYLIEQGQLPHKPDTIDSYISEREAQESGDQMFIEI